MGRKIAVLFPGIKYTCDKPLFYYSEKLLEKYGYEVIKVNYKGLEDEPFYKAFEDGAIYNGGPANKISKEKLLSFVAKAKELTKSQLTRIDFDRYDKIIFLEKSIGTVVGTIIAAQYKINPFHMMITPIDYAFQFAGKANGCAFIGTEDTLCNNAGIKTLCKERGWTLNAFKGCDHSLETGRLDEDIEQLQKFLATIDTITADIDKSIYDCEVTTRDNRIVKMSDYKGKVLLIVNTATGCGYTPQYSTLEQFYKTYKNDGLEILDFPCNQFSNQAPGSNDEIYSFCTARYEITFEQFAKINVNGDEQTELFEYLKARKGFKGFDTSTPDGRYLAHKLEKEDPEYETSSDIKWNFTKFLVNREGQVVERFEPIDDLNTIEKSIREVLY